MSFRSKERVHIPARRSSSTSRAPSSSSSMLSRPHTLGLYSTGTSSPVSSYQRNNYSLPQSPSYKSSYSPSNYGQTSSNYSPVSSNYMQSPSNYGQSPYTSLLGSPSYGYTSNLHGSLNSLNNVGGGYANKRNSYTSKSKHGGYGDRKNNGYSSFTLAFESPKHYQPNTSPRASATPTPPERSRQRTRSQRGQRSSEKNDDGTSKGLEGKRSISLNSLASEGYASGSERSSRSRLGSSSSLVDGDATENGDMLDYKALWETAKADNERLQEQLKKRNEELKDAKATIDRVSNVTNKNSLSELEKRERRAMERKLSEMEEELKQLQKLKSENERLRAENRALTRVVSKLTSSANK